MGVVRPAVATMAAPVVDWPVGDRENVYGYLGGLGRGEAAWGEEWSLGPGLAGR